MTRHSPRQSLILILDLVQQFLRTDGTRIAWFKDPDGYTLSVAQF
jgi:hypothetical protein